MRKDAHGPSFRPVKPGPGEDGCGRIFHPLGGSVLAEEDRELLIIVKTENGVAACG